MPYRGFDAETEKAQNIIGQEIAKIRIQRGLSQSDLCKLLAACGVKVQFSAISKWERGENIPHTYQFLALCHALGISNVLDTFQSEPMLNREGRELTERYRTDLIASGRYRPRREEPDNLDNLVYVDMPVSLLPASAGTGEFLDGDSFELVSVPENTIPKGAERGIRVSGDSMEPVYHGGQIAWMKPCAELRPGEVGIFLYDGGGYIKVYQERNADGGSRQPVLVSYNRDYAPIPVLPGREFRIFGRVLN